MKSYRFTPPGVGVSESLPSSPLEAQDSAPDSSLPASSTQTLASATQPPHSASSPFNPPASNLQLLDFLPIHQCQRPTLQNAPLFGSFFTLRLACLPGAQTSPPGAGNRRPRAPCRHPRFLLRSLRERLPRQRRQAARPQTYDPPRCHRSDLCPPIAPQQPPRRRAPIRDRTRRRPQRGTPRRRLSTQARHVARSSSAYSVGIP